MQGVYSYIVCFVWRCMCVQVFTNIFFCSVQYSVLCTRFWASPS